MLKFKNRLEGGVEAECCIKMSVVPGGVQCDFDQIPENGRSVSESILLTPMDAALFVEMTGSTQGLECWQCGHSERGETLSVSKASHHELGQTFIGTRGGCEEVWIHAGSITMHAPAFVVNAMRLGIESIMGSLMYPTTGDMEEEFGR